MFTYPKEANIIHTYTIGTGTENHFILFIITPMTKINFSIPEIHCMSCELLIKLALKKLPGIKATSVNLRDKTAMIDFDDSLVSKEKIQQQIQKDTGYKVL